MVLFLWTLIILGLLVARLDIVVYKNETKRKFDREANQLEVPIAFTARDLFDFVTTTDIMFLFTLQLKIWKKV